MSIIKTGRKTHDDTCNNLEMIRQVACGGGASAAAIKAAEISYYRGCLSSAIADGGVSPVPFITALHDLGTGGS